MTAAVLEPETVPDVETPPVVPLLHRGGPWLSCVLGALGTGLVAAGLAHAPVRPLHVAAGAVLVVLAEVVRAPERPSLLSLGGSLLAGLGAGALVGGVQHATVLPLLAPAGLVLTYAGLVLRAGSPRGLLSKVGAGVLVLAAVLHLGLDRVVPAPAVERAPAAPAGDLERQLAELTELQARLEELQTG